MKAVNCDERKSFWIICSSIALLISVLFGVFIVRSMNKCDSIDDYLIDWMNQEFQCHDFNQNNWCEELSEKCGWNGKIKKSGCDCIAVERMGIHDIETRLNTTAEIQVFVISKCGKPTVLNHDDQCRKITCDIEHGCPMDCILWGSFRNKYCFTGLEETEQFTDKHNLTSGGKCGTKLHGPIHQYTPMSW